MSIKNLYTNLNKEYQNLNVNSINAEHFGTILTESITASIGAISVALVIEFIKFGNIVIVYVPQFELSPIANAIGILDFQIPDGFKPSVGGFIGSGFSQLNATTTTNFIVYSYNFGSNRFVFVPDTLNGLFTLGNDYDFLNGSYLYYYV